MTTADLDGATNALERGADWLTGDRSEATRSVPESHGGARPQETG